MGFGALRVINDDVIAPSSGFGMHPHRDMEIITIVNEGAVTHQDSEGNKGEVAAGEVQVMSAGTGVLHSEHNTSGDETLKLFQIWIFPEKNNVPVRYAQKNFDFKNTKEAVLPLVAPIGAADHGELTINQRAWITQVLINGEPFEYTVKGEGNGAYILVVEGTISVDGETLKDRDAIGVSETESVRIEGEGTILIIDVPMAP